MATCTNTLGTSASWYHGEPFLKLFLNNHNSIELKTKLEGFQKKPRQALQRYSIYHGCTRHSQGTAETAPSSGHRAEHKLVKLQNSRF